MSFRGLVGQLSCAAQAASQPSQIKIRKLLYHRFLSGGFLLVMYNRRDRRVIPSRNSGGTFHPFVRPQGFMAAQRPCFIRQGRPAVAFHTIVRRRTRYIPTSDQALCPVGIPRGKAASKVDKCATNVPLWQGSLGYVLFGTGSGLSCIATSFI